MNRLILAASMTVAITAGCAAPTPSAAPTGAPAATATLAPSNGTEQVRLNVTDGPDALRVVLDVPPTWQRGDPEPADSHSVVRGDTLPPTGMFILFGTFANTYADPCGHVLRTPEVGPSVDDLVAAFGEIPSTTSTEPVETTLGGRPATYVELTVDDELPCEPDSFYLTSDDQGLYFFVDGPAQVMRTWVLDVDGTRAVVWAFHFPEASAEGLAEEQAIIDSVEFEPAN